VAAEQLQGGLRPGLAELFAPAGEDVAYVAVRLAGKQRRGPVPGQPARQVVAGQWRAQARDEPAEIITLDVTEQRGRAGQPDPRPVDFTTQLAADTAR
jgi:hypothetical protein